ncbi:hypothetical protein ACFL6C_14485, partial [Myxococcota bacterium]
MRPPQILPEGFTHEVVDGQIGVQGALATEPFAKVQLVNLRTNALSDIQASNTDNFVQLSIEGRKDDPVMIRVIDGTGDLSDVGSPHLRERRLTFNAGSKKTPVLAQNPRLGLEQAPRVLLDRIAVKKDVLVGKRAVPPGHVIEVNNDSAANRDFVTIAGADGSFKLPAEICTNDVLTVSVKSPFGSPAFSFRVQAVSAPVQQGKGTKTSSLELEPRYGDGEAIEAMMGGPAIRPTPNVDLVEGIHVRRSLPDWQLLGLDEDMGMTIRQPAIECGVIQNRVTSTRDGNKIVYQVDVGYEHGGWIGNGTVDQPLTLPLTEKNGSFDVEVRNKATNELLATAKLQVESGSRTAYRVAGGYDGRGGILPASSIPTAAVQEPYTNKTFSDIVLCS